jgi:hypothetical protein
MSDLYYNWKGTENPMFSLDATFLFFPSSSVVVRRRRIVLGIGLALLMTLPGGSQTDNRASIFTDGYFNCRGWRGSSATEKNMWMLGFGEGFNVGVIALSIDGGKTAPDEAFYNRIHRGYFGAATLTLGEKAEVMDALCTVPENSLVEVSDMLKIVGMKADGSTPDAIDKVIRFMRSQASGAKSK